MSPSPVLPALLAALLFAGLVLSLAWPTRAGELVTRAALLASGGLLLLESWRTGGGRRAVAAAGAVVALGSLVVGVRALSFLLAHGLSGVWGYGVPASVAVVLVAVARRRAAEGG
jgi:hypothetical protein